MLSSEFWLKKAGFINLHALREVLFEKGRSYSLLPFFITDSGEKFCLKKGRSQLACSIEKFLFGKKQV